MLTTLVTTVAYAQNDPLVTFVVASRGRPTLMRTLRSIATQHSQAWRLMLIMDGVEAPADALRLRQQRPDAISIIASSKLGTANSNHGGAVRNAAITHIIDDSEWVAFVDDDDTISPFYVDALHKELKSQPQADGVLFRMSVNDTATVLGSRIIPAPYVTSLRLNDVGISFAVRTEVARQHPFVPSSREDFDFLRTMTSAGHQLMLSGFIAYFVRQMPSDQPPTSAEATVGNALASIRTSTGAYAPFWDGWLHAADVRLGTAWQLGPHPFIFSRDDSHSIFFRDNVRGLAHSLQTALAAGCMPCAEASTSKVAVLLHDERLLSALADEPAPRQTPFGKGNTIVLQLEQLNHKRFVPPALAQTRRLLGAAAHVWDFSEASATKLGPLLGRPVEYMPLTTSVNPTVLRPSQADSFTTDALLFGLLTPERTALCTRVQALSIRTVCSQSLWGEDLVRAVRSSKIVFGQHVYANASLPVHRINQALAQGTPVVYPPSSDPALDALYARWGVVFCPEEALPSCLSRLLSSADGGELDQARAKTRLFQEHIRSQAESREGGALCTALTRMCATSDAFDESAQTLPVHDRRGLLGTSPPTPFSPPMPFTPPPPSPSPPPPSPSPPPPWPSPSPGAPGSIVTQAVGFQIVSSEACIEGEDARAIKCAAFRAQVASDVGVAEQDVLCALTCGSLIIDIHITTQDPGDLFAVLQTVSAVYNSSSSVAAAFGVTVASFTPAYQTTVLTSTPSPPTTTKEATLSVGVLVASIFGALAVITLVCVLVAYRRFRQQESDVVIDPVSPKSPAPQRGVIPSMIVARTSSNNPVVASEP